MSPFLAHSPLASLMGTLTLPFHQSHAGPGGLNTASRPKEEEAEREKEGAQRRNGDSLGGGVRGEFFPKCSTIFFFFEKDSF